jgi:type IV pilus biogenesis protein CpaD/CtpE
MRATEWMMAVVLAVAQASSVSGCAAQDSDFTPQIPVAPGVGARLRWIQSKNLPELPAAEADPEAAPPADETAGEAEETGDAGGRNIDLPRAESPKTEGE